MSEIGLRILEKIRQDLIFEHNMTGHNTVAKDLRKAVRNIEHAIEYIRRLTHASNNNQNR